MRFEIELLASGIEMESWENGSINIYSHARMYKNGIAKVEILILDKVYYGVSCCTYSML